jgi:hypothetical protein
MHDSRGGVLGCLGSTHHLKKFPFSLLANPRDFHKSVVEIFNKFWGFFWPAPSMFVDKNHDPKSYLNFFYSIWYKQELEIRLISYQF